MMLTGGRRPRGRSLAVAPRATLPAVIAVSLAIALLVTPSVARLPDREGRPATLVGSESDTGPPAGTGRGIVIGFNLTEGAAAAQPYRPLSTPTSSPPEKPRAVTRLAAVPLRGAVNVESVVLIRGGARTLLSGAEARAVASVRVLGLLRNQRIAAVTIDDVERADNFDAIEVALGCEDAEGPISRATGPFTGACRSVISNYQATDTWSPPASRAASRFSSTVSYCESVEDCVSAGIDILILAAEDLYATPTLLSLANYHASTTGLNVGIVCSCALPERSSDAIYQFIDAVYESESAEHFGDGRLGFVLLVGDAYEDDNATPMLPSYYGYGGQEEASDHYYACLSGDDDIEDVMVGRLSVGNLDELAGAAGKTISYKPVPSWEEWTRRVLLIGGLFYTIKDDYVALFDQYDGIIPESHTVDRIYRHDFGTDQACALSVVDAMNDGAFIVNFAGDGWISLWDHVLNTGHLDLLTNSSRLPIVLSMACDTGRFDNITEPDASGSVDCLAEQFVNMPQSGAVACLAAPRASDGGMFKTFTKEIYRAVFEENSTFLGEVFAVAKLLHLEGGGDPAYTRHFNLFGAPSLVFTWDEVPPSKPDLTLQPHRIVWHPDYPGAGDDLLVTVPVTNQSPVLADNVLVRLAGHNAAGPYTRYGGIDEISGWSTGTVTIAIPHLGAGENLYEVIIDPYNVIPEIDETNNYTARNLYVYPLAEGFPVDLGRGLLSPTVARLGDQTRILVIDDEGRTLSLFPDGSQDWASDALSEPPDLGPEIAPAVGDIDGDGQPEIVSTKSMGVVAFSASGQELWRAITDNPIGYPLLADVDGDADLDVVVATKPFFGGTCSILAFDEWGDEIWSVALPSGSVVTSAPTAGDLDIDGRTEIVIGTIDGRVFALSCSQDPPVDLWPAVQAGSARIDAILLADLDDDGTLEIVAGGENLAVLNAEDGTPDRNVVLDGNVVSLSLADVNGDGRPEVVAGTDAPCLHLIEDGAATWSAALTGVPGTSAAVLDFDGGGSQEIVVGTDSGDLCFFRDDGTELLPPAPIGTGCLTPAAGDLDGAGGPEIVVTSPDGLLFALSMEEAGASFVLWDGLGGGAGHSGLYAQPLHGTISADCLLTGTSVVTDDLIIAAGATLTVAPGAAMLFRPLADPSLSVQGSLVAVADSLAPVVFGTGVFRGDWEGIEIDPGASAVLKWCEISNASLAVSASQATITLEDCSLLSNTVGACLDECTLVATRCDVVNSGGVGMLIQGGASTITDCRFEQNASAGIECRDHASGTISGSDFSNSFYGDGARFYRHSNMSVYSSTFSDNHISGVLVNNASPYFEECTFTGNTGDGIYCRRSAGPLVRWSLISGNRFGVYADGKSIPELGNAVFGYGNNWVTDNWAGAVMNAAGDATTIAAVGNWWGSSPPSAGLFRGSIIYEPWLEEPPVLDRPTTVPYSDSPASFALGQNTPNPFNPVTAIRYLVPEPGADVEILVFDTAGRLITTLRSGYSRPGAHEILWDGRDSRGREVASGVYFVRMAAGDFAATRKMLLVK